jgi:serine/threonine-protein kinase
VIAVGVVAGLCGAALVASIAQPRTTQPEAAHPETQPETTQPQTTQSIVRADAPDPVAPATDVQPPEPADPATLEPAPSTFTLTVRSAPPGATLSRDGEELGETPISIELDPEALRDAPARFTLRLRGRADVHFEQGPSASDVTIERTLPRHPRHRPSDEGRARGGDLSIKTQR